MKLMEEQWRRVEAVLVREGIGAPQRRIMARSFFGGAGTVLALVGEAMKSATGPEGFVSWLDELALELNRIREQGLPLAEDAGAGGAGGVGGNGMLHHGGTEGTEKRGRRI